MTRRGGRVKTEEDPFEIPGLRISELSGLSTEPADPGARAPASIDFPRYGRRFPTPLTRDSLGKPHSEDLRSKLLGHERVPCSVGGGRWFESRNVHQELPG